MHIPITISNKKIPKGTRIIKQKKINIKHLESLNKNTQRN